VEGIVAESDDLEADVDALRGRGVAIGDIEEAPWGRFVTLPDPDGNGIRAADDRRSGALTDVAEVFGIEVGGRREVDVPRRCGRCRVEQRRCLTVDDSGDRIDDRGVGRQVTGVAGVGVT
jgi:hypothetical protein